MGGWQVNPDLIVQILQVIGAGNGVFVYTGSGGAGNLRVSVTGPSTLTDTYGNAIVGELTAYTKISPTLYVALSILGDEIQAFTATSEAGPWSATGCAVSFDQTNMYIAFGAGVQVTFNGALNVVNFSCNVQLNGPLTQISKLEVVGTTEFAGAVTADVGAPVTLNDILTANGGTRANPSVFTSDSWTTFGAFGAGFGAGGIAPQQLYTPVGANGKGSVELRGQILSTAATAANSTMVTAQAGPTQNVAFVVPTNAAGYTPAAGSLPRVVLVDTAGNVRLQPTTSAANQFVLLDGIHYTIG